MSNLPLPRAAIAVLSALLWGSVQVQQTGDLCSTY